MEGKADATVATAESGDVLGEGANSGDEDVADLGDEDDSSGEDGVTLDTAAVLAEEVDSVNVVGDVAVACDVAVVGDAGVAGNVSAVSAWWTQRSAL